MTFPWLSVIWTAEIWQCSPVGFVMVTGHPLGQQVEEQVSAASVTDPPVSKLRVPVLKTMPAQPSPQSTLTEPEVKVCMGLVQVSA